jgi:hypothetical protein
MFYFQLFLLNMLRFTRFFFSTRKLDKKSAHAVTEKEFPAKIQDGLKKQHNCMLIKNRE